MDDVKFTEMVRSMRLMKASDPNFSAEKFVNMAELSEEQKIAIEKELGKKKKIWIENSLFYNYVSESDSDF